MIAKLSTSDQRCTINSHVCYISMKKSDEKNNALKLVVYGSKKLFYILYIHKYVLKICILRILFL